MIKEQFIWFIDSRFFYQTKSLDKMVHLILPNQKTLKIIIDASAQLKGRGYWHLFAEKEILSDEIMAKIELKKAQLVKFFAMNAIDVEVSINKSTDYLSVLNAEIANDSQSLVVIEDNAVAQRHSIFQRLTAINAPLLLLSKQAWHQPLSIVAAVDPLHEHARSGALDANIVALAERWAKPLKASWMVAHCYYVTSVLSQYKSKVLSQHKQGLMDFAKKHRIATNQCVLLEGVPEEVLATYINKNSCHILVMGLVTRNKLEQLWVGSTTTALLNELPCDLLLLKK
ncbi:universal stress protein [Psychromonas sp. 14N.309.X.WAT.B.A12]|uniref:universal stress protein n=1 Tax=Psychromonas sp. 14N.309.X.WAT.B.A12 TaxID=2998322 RepID=UPI0025B01F75|nr:universal stress protein [Psychromonas sp. 14N.309.X.WAT.B.A12]MDN2663416.1 universal stress protein [Psychromonas sp. 14N.309.X.WAT.B.A12]